MLPATAAAGAGQPEDAYEPQASLELYWKNGLSVAATLSGMSVDPGPWAALLEESFGCAAGSVESYANDVAASLWGPCPGALRKQGLRLVGRFDLEPLAAALRAQGARQLFVRAYPPPYPLLRLDGPGSWDLAPPEPGYPGPRGLRWLVVDLSTRESLEIALEVGYGGRAIAMRLGAWAVALALPLLWAWSRRRRHRAEAVATGEEAWFGCLRTLQGTGLGALFLWLSVYPALGTWDFLRMVAQPAPSWVARGLFFTLLLTPPVAIAFGAQRLYDPVFRLMGRLDSVRELRRHSAWTLAATVVPAFACLLGVLALFEAPRVGASFFLLGAIAFVLALGRLLSGGDLAPHAVTMGELRDRVFELARQLGVELKQLYVMSGRRARLANAFAASGNRVVLTDYLLQKLERREVDAVVAHELAHLRHKHPRGLMLAILVPTVVLALAATLITSWLGFWQGEAPHFWELLFVGSGVGALAFLAVSRRFEKTADAEAVRLTGDPASLISALARLTRANLLPRSWSGRYGWLLTHPSLEERAREIASLGKLDPGELAGALAPSEVVEDERYAVPEIDRAGERLFTTGFKTRLALRGSLTVMAWVALAPCLVASATSLLPPAARGWALLGALPLLAVSTVAVTGRVAAAGYPALGRALGDRLAPRGLTDWSFVGLAPDPRPRVYELMSDWDVGVLWLEPQRLVYLGDAVRFAIPREAILSQALVPGLPGWSPEQRILLRYRDGSTEEELTIKVGGASVAAGRVSTAHLSRRLQSWIDEGGGAPAPPGSPAGLGMPRFGRVTSASPRSLVAFGPLAQGVAMTTLAALIAALLVGLSFASMAGWYPVLVGPGLSLMLAAPALRHRD
jgi:Zn-dependent protease with chaperone function